MPTEVMPQEPNTDLHLRSGSISSVDSNGSTENLIKSLSQHGLSSQAQRQRSASLLHERELPMAESSLTAHPVNTESDSNNDDSNTSHQFIISPVIANNSMDFNLTSTSTTPAASSPVAGSPSTSHATLPKADKKPVKFTVRKVSRDTITTPNSGRLDPKVKEYAYGNLPQNKDKVQPKRTLTKTEQLETSQAKYDLYTAKIAKINKEIDFLTNLLPPYNVEIDYNTRTKITRAIEKLRAKQDEIEKKKYTLGITISRLWREHDNSEIWVRSVSNQ